MNINIQRAMMTKKNMIPILEKALDIMEYIGASPDAVSQPELQKMLHIPQATCYRIVNTLTERRWLEKRGVKHFDIAPGISAVSGKIRLHIEKYRKLQPLMNRIASHVKYSVKFSVRDSSDFINVCAAKNNSEAAVFSEVGFRAPLRQIASVSTIFLAEETEEGQKLIAGAGQMEFLKAKLSFYRIHDFTFQEGHASPKASYHFDTLSLPARCNGKLAGVLSLLSLPGVIAADMEKIAVEAAEFLSELAEKADI